MPKSPEAAFISFENPPVAEVSFGLFFTPLANFRAAHFGLFWSRVREQFIETADKPVVADLTPEIQSGEWFPLPRVWLIHSDKQYLLQLQANRFYFNWRRVSPEVPYPTFAKLEPQFIAYVEQFSKFVKDESLGAIDIAGCDLTYVNQIPSGAGWTRYEDIHEIFPDFRWEPRHSPLSPLKGLAWTARFETAGIHLKADVKSGTMKADDKQLVFQFDLRATSTERLSSINSVRDWMRKANQALVVAFLDLTSEAFQRDVWRMGKHVS